MTVARGRNLALRGDCVLGAGAAKALGLEHGDSLLSSPETLFDLAGVYSLKMRVAGILAPTHSADDLAVFVDLKTAWIIQGLVVSNPCANRPEAGDFVGVISNNAGNLKGVFQSRSSDPGAIRSRRRQFEVPIQKLGGVNQVPPA